MSKFWERERLLMVNRDQVSRFHHLEGLPRADRESGIRIYFQIDQSRDGLMNPKNTSWNVSMIHWETILLREAVI